MIRIPVTFVAVLLGYSVLAQAEWGISTGPRIASVRLKGEGRQSHTAGSLALGGNMGVWFQSRPSPKRIALGIGLGFSAMHLSFRDSIQRDTWTKTTEVRCIELPIQLRHGIGQRVQGSVGLLFAVPIYYSDVVEGVRSGYQFPNNIINNEHYRIAIRSTYPVSRLIAGLTWGLSCRVGKRYAVEIRAVLPVNRTEKFVYAGASFEYLQNYSTVRTLYHYLGLSCSYTIGKAAETIPAPTEAP